jgi:GTP-binding protein
VRVACELVASAAREDEFPRERLPELALVGRSNVGKSRLINALVGRPVARISAAPGKTRVANFYRVAPEGRPPFYLVDLPGYGYARGPRRATREAFDRLAAAYFGKTGRVDFSEDPRGKNRPGLFFRGVLVLVDSRHPALAADAAAWAWLGGLGVARHVVATKVDKLTAAERRRHLAALEERCATSVLPVSAATGEGLNELWKTIARLLTRP